MECYQLRVTSSSDSQMLGDVDVSYGVWSYMSPTRKRVIEWNGKVFGSVYALMWSFAFPSKMETLTLRGRDKNGRTSVSARMYIRESGLDREYFEVDEKVVVREVLKVLRRLYDEDEVWRELLMRTKGRKVKWSDEYDVYFGGKRNVYGKCLMIVRDEARRDR